VPSPAENLQKLGLSLPPVTMPVAAYVPWVQHGDLLFLAGQIPLKDGKVQYAGLVGEAQDLPAAQAAAKLCALNALGVAAHAAGGLEAIARVVKVVVYVAAAPGFTDIHLVANGASELLGAVFEENGKHARAAVGVATLPLNASVEVDVTFALRA
jgi:enamine deaminase RidA (YjgF/YER057c/UK114 family)